MVRIHHGLSSGTRLLLLFLVFCPTISWQGMNKKLTCTMAAIRHRTRTPCLLLRTSHPRPVDPNLPVRTCICFFSFFRIVHSCDPYTIFSLPRVRDQPYNKPIWIIFALCFPVECFSNTRGGFITRQHGDLLYPLVDLSCVL